MTLPQLPADKANHLVYGAFAFNVAYPVTGAVAALALVAVAAVGKELVDWVLNRRARLAGRVAPHGVELLDAVATVAGGFLCFIPLTHF